MILPVGWFDVIQPAGDDSSTPGTLVLRTDTVVFEGLRPDDPERQCRDSVQSSAAGGRGRSSSHDRGDLFLSGKDEYSL
jgi:hypothetical protein